MSKERITVTVDKELLKWLDKKVKAYEYANRSHGIEYVISKKVK